MSDPIPLKPEHYKELLELIKEFSVFEKRPHLVVNTLKKMLKEQNLIRGFGIWNNEQLIAYVVFYYTYHTWSGKGLYMDDLFVKEEFRNQGLGAKLLDAVVQIAQKENCYDVRWLVSKWNTSAIKFYQKKEIFITENEAQCQLILKPEK